MGKRAAAAASSSGMETEEAYELSPAESGTMLANQLLGIVMDHLPDEKTRFKEILGPLLVDRNCLWVSLLNHSETWLMSNLLSLKCVIDECSESAVMQPACPGCQSLFWSLQSWCQCQRAGSRAPSTVCCRVGGYQPLVVSSANESDGVWWWVDWTIS